MSTALAVLAPPPTQNALVGQDGLLSSPWVVYFQKLNDRVGGPVSLTLTQVSASVVTLQTNVTTINGQVATLQTGQTTLNGQVTTLSTTQTTQAGQITTQGGQISALQAQLAPGISVTITTVKLTAGGVNGSMTFTNGILTAQVQAT